MRTDNVIDKYYYTEENNQNLNSEEFGEKHDRQHDNNDNMSMNPWRWPFANIATGLLFTTFTLNFKNLQYILPTLGVLMIFLGFRSLQRVNVILKRTWFLTLFRLIYQVMLLIILASPWNVYGDYSLVLGVIGTIYQIVFLLTFRSGMTLLFQDIKMKPSRDPLKSAIAWNISVVIIGVLGLGVSWLFIIPMIIWLLVTITSISNYSDDLQLIKYNAPQFKKVRSNFCFGIGYLLLCYLFTLGTSALSNHLRLDSSIYNPGTDINSRAKLMEMGFPEHVLQDLSDDNIKLFQQAAYVEARKQKLMFDPKEVNTSKTKSHTIIEQIPGDNNMESTTVYIEMEDGNMYVLEYFEMKDGRAYWQDGFSILGEECIELVDGKLLYDDDGMDYIATIPQLTMEPLMVNNSVFGGSFNLQIRGTVSYPFGTDHQRGYVLYRVLLNDGTVNITNNLFYVHYSHPFKFPYTEAQQDVMSWNSGCKQHYSSYSLDHTEIEINKQ